MSLGFGTRRVVALGLMAAGLAAGSAGRLAGQSSVALTEPNAPLLPEMFGGWRHAGAGETPGFSLVNVNKDALEECGPKRSQVADYARGGRTMHVEAVQFGDRTGATSAFTLVERQGMTVGKELGGSEAVGTDPNSEGAVLFTVGSTVVLVNFGGAVTAADVAALKPLAAGLPKVTGSKGVAPLLPSLAPTKGLLKGSVRYALGPATYAAEGGVLKAGSLSWDKEPEAVTALYDDARGKETVTLLLYPTPTIAGDVAKVIQGQLPQMGGAAPRMRREGPLVALATGSFAADEAQRLIENVHLSQMTFNQDVHPTFHIAAVQTYSLLTNIAILSGVLMTAAVLLGLFLGVGRATFRVMRGKPAALEPEFLSLHLSPQSKPAQFTRTDSVGPG